MTLSYPVVDPYGQLFPVSTGSKIAALSLGAAAAVVQLIYFWWEN